jgi:hypothetical protein
MPNSLSVEIVIPSYNRLAILASTVRAIRRLYPDIPICLGLQGDMPDPDLQVEFDRERGLRIERMASPSSTITMTR